MAMTRDAACAVGADGLEFLAHAPEELGRFLAETGAGPDDVRASRTDPAFLGRVLEFISQEEARAQAFCEGADLSPEEFAAARAALPGSDAPYWM